MYFLDGRKRKRQEDEKGRTTKVKMVPTFLLYIWSFNEIYSPRHFATNIYKVLLPFILLCYM